MYDAIVVGARCAGAPTAMLLARRGYKTLLLDRARFPSDVPHGHFIHRDGPRRLAQWGLLDRIVAGGCPATTSFLSDFGDFPLVGRDLVQDGIAFGYAPRRRLLDKVLVDAAVAAGVELREGFSVDGPLTDGERVTGIRGRGSPGGVTVSERARITIGADGRNSRLARAVQTRTYDVAPNLTFYYFSYWSGVPCDALEVYRRPRRLLIVHPTNDGLTVVLAVWPADEIAAFRSDVAGNYWRTVELVPAVAERLRQGRREERIYGITDLPNFFRKPYGPGWALVGDAGHHKDPYLALGISDAFRDAEDLANVVDRGFSGQCSLDDALAAYERGRNAAVRVDYRRDLQDARLGPFHPDVTRLREALREDPEEARRFYLAEEGLIPREEFFSATNLRRILSRPSVLAR